MTRRTALEDTECYKDYFLALFKDLITGKFFGFEQYPGHPLDTKGLERTLKTYRIITFNGNHYDMPLLALALAGADNANLKAMSDTIIQGGVKWWNAVRMYGVEIPSYLDHIDIFEVTPGLMKASLKAYGGRIHSKKIQDLPIPPDASISPAQRPILRSYCGNDLHTTGDLFWSLKPQIELREMITAKTKIDVRSKSDAQMAETLITARVEEVRGCKVVKDMDQVGKVFHYAPPVFISFHSNELNAVLDKIKETEFVVGTSGAIETPEWLKKDKVVIGNSVYRMGIGGLHSSEESVTHIADDETILVDRDVTSYYPSIILELGLYPAQMGEAFLDVYRETVEHRIRDKRLAAETKKKLKDNPNDERLKKELIAYQASADTRKIELNGSFGKFGSRYSTLYSPSLLIQTTLTGQLSLLMLIEELERYGIPVVSANTDGVVIKCPKALVDEMETIIAVWEFTTGFNTEETRYKAIYIKNVNNYIAFYE